MINENNDLQLMESTGFCFDDNYKNHERENELLVNVPYFENLINGENEDVDAVEN